MNNKNSKISINDEIAKSSKENLENIKEDIILDSKKLEIDSFFKKNFGSRETLFYIALPSFKKIIKDEIDKKLISLYLTQMKKFMELLKKVTSNNNENNGNAIEKSQGDDIYDLIYHVSAHILYQYFPANRVLMRFGDEGEKFYMLLNGIVTIIVARKKTVNISLNEYFRYISLLIIYKEQQILKQVVRESKNTNFIEIPGINYFFVISNEQNPLILMRDIYLSIKYKNKPQEKFNKNSSESSIKINSNKSKENIEKSRKKSEKKRKKSSFDEPKKNYKELEIEFERVEEFLNIYLTEEELAFYYKSLNDEKYDIFEIDDNINVSPENYTKRIQNYFFDINAFKKKKLKNKKELLNNVISNENKINKLSIYEYNILVELNSGDMFGEAALSAPSLKRNATIMTVTDCHFGCLNRKIYQKHIQKATETYKKNIINYICNTGIFNGFPKDILRKKFFPVFVFKKNKKNELIIKQNEFNDNIVLIKEGIYEIIFTGNMVDIYNLINAYHKKLFLLNKNNEQDDEIHKKVMKMKDQKAKIEKIFGNEMYKTEKYKILLIESPSTFGLREVEEKVKIDDKEENSSYHYMSYYDVKCSSIKGEYILIDKNTFYRQIYSTEYTVQECTKAISLQIIIKLINRLLNIRLSKIYSLFLEKGFNKDFLNDKNNKEGNLNNLNFNYSQDFYKRINSLIDNCNEDKLLSNNLEEYVFNYFENKKEKYLREKREFKNRKEKFKQNKIKKTLLKENSDSDFINNNTNTNLKNFSITRVSSAVNNRSKISFALDKKIDKFHLSKKEKLILIPVIKNKRNKKKFADLKYFDKNSKGNLSPKNIKKKFEIQANKLYKGNDSIYDSVLTHKIKYKNNYFVYPKEKLFYRGKHDLCSQKNEIEDYKNSINVYNRKPKINILGGKHLVDIPKLLFNKSKSAYELKTQNQENFIKNRSNYVINITRSFFTKKKDFNRKIRLKSS